MITLEVVQGCCVLSPGEGEEGNDILVVEHPASGGVAIMMRATQWEESRLELIQPLTEAQRLHILNVSNFQTIDDVYHWLVGLTTHSS